VPFGLSWDRIILVLIVLVFVVGPERIPTAVNWAMSSLRKLRTMASGAQAELRTQIGPELDELRRQVAELQSLKEIQELRTLRDLNPKTIIGKNFLGEEFSGGITGFLGLNKTDNGESGSSAGGGSTAVAGAADPGATAASNGGAEPSAGAVGGASGYGGDSGQTIAAAPDPTPVGGSADQPAAALAGAGRHRADPGERAARVLGVGETPPVDYDAT
jgi:sec-independent protein translocase protein TatB